MLNLNKSTAIVCHDAGATNIILSWLRTNNMVNIRPVMKGPAEKLWKCYFPKLPTFNKLEEAIDGCHLIISGTGWASDIEHDARAIAKQMKITSIAILDHWVNYPDRFIRNNTQIWPDKFWVTDNYALIEAKKYFPSSKIALVHNYYLENQITLIKNHKIVDPPVLLYILEPLHTKWGETMLGEFQSLNYLIENIEKLNLPKEFIIRLRPHPSDAENKYLKWINENNERFIIELDTEPLHRSIGQSKWIAGCESYALAIALYSGKKVFCTLPPWGHSCRLPQKKITHIKALP